MILTWAERCEKFDDEIVTNAMIQQAMQEEIDELRSKIDTMLDHNVQLTDDLFAERKEVIKLEAELNEAGHMIGVLREEISLLKEKLELAEWDEDAWKKFKQNNYEVINLGDIKDDCK